MKVSLLFKDSSSEGVLAIQGLKQRGCCPCYSRTQAVRLLSLLFKDSGSEVVVLAIQGLRQ